MNVLIRGMKIPSECRKCFMMDYGIMTGETHCKVNGKTLAESYRPIEFDGRPDWCPLVELPKKHGRLIDENDVIDAVRERLRVLQSDKAFVKKHGDIDLLGTLPYIAKIPTVFEE